MDPYDTSNYDPSAFLAIYFGVLGVTIFVALLFAIAYYVVMALALSTFFRKVGVKPWIAWVPYYNRWVWMEVGGHQGWLALLSLIPYGGIVASVFLCIGMYRTGFAFRKDSAFVVLGIFLPFVWAFVLGGRNEVYQPELMTARGYPPPLAGFGSPTYATNASSASPV